MAIEFGTDGVRDVYETPEIGYHVGRAAADSLELRNFVMVQDTRHFNPELAEAITDGLANAGAEVIDLGILPTPAAAITADSLTQAYGVPYGAFSLSASHNPGSDFGIKVFGAGGAKLSDEQTARLQQAANEDSPVRYAHPEKVVSQDYIDTLRQEYIDYLVATRLPGLDANFLQGTDLVLDTANGAAYWSAAEALRRLGANVQTINDNPLGEINKDAGATHPEAILAATSGTGNVGLSFDGDADRLFAVSPAGRELDGDDAIHIAMIGEVSSGGMIVPKAVSTRYSNFGLRRALHERGMSVTEVINGDRAVAEAMGTTIPVGGERSGHTLFNTVAQRLERVLSGDGTVTAIQLLGYATKSARSLDELAVPERYPHREEKVKGVSPHAFETKQYKQTVEAVTQAQGTEGDNLSRMSGTEKGVGRILVRDIDADRAEWAMHELQDAAKG